MKPEETLEQKVERLMGFLDEMQDRCKAILEHYNKEPREFYLKVDHSDAQKCYIFGAVGLPNFNEVIHVKEVIE